MPWTYNELGVSLGPTYTGLAGTVGYRVLDQTKAPGAGDSIVVTFRTSGILEAAVPGDYVVPAPPAFPDVPVRIEWSVDGGTTFLYSKTLDPTLLESLSTQLAALPAAVVAAAGLGAPGPDRCQLYGYETFGVSDKPVTRRRISLELVTPPAETVGVILETETVEVYTGPNGYWEFYPPRLSTCRLIIAQAGVNALIDIPDAASVNARDLL